jgi:hypothetical protein
MSTGITVAPNVTDFTALAVAAAGCVVVSIGSVFLGLCIKNMLPVITDWGNGLSNHSMWMNGKVPGNQRQPCTHSFSLLWIIINIMLNNIILKYNAFAPISLR